MWNPTSTGLNVLTNTTATLTLGFGPNMTAPPEVLVQNLTASGTVTLPKIGQVPPTAPGTPGTTPGIGDGYPLIIKNIAAFTTTITPASGDTCDVALVSNIGDTVLLVADNGNSKWRAIAPLVTTSNQVVTASGANTVASTTRYLIMTGAVTITLTTTTFPNYQPITIINESSGSDTITPSAGNINTTASFTLTTLKSATFLSDGTNWHLVDN
jgi:hypothetical protein